MTAITDLGCTISDLANFTTEIFRFLFFAGLQIVTDPVNIPSFLSGWNFTQADIYLAAGLACFVDFAGQLNLPLGQIVQYASLAFTQFFKVRVTRHAYFSLMDACYSFKVLIKFAGLIFDPPALEAYVANNGLRNDSQFFIFTLNGTGIAIGNFWRQWDTSALAGTCPVVDPGNQLLRTSRSCFYHSLTHMHCRLWR